VYLSHLSECSTIRLQYRFADFVPYILRQYVLFVTFFISFVALLSGKPQGIRANTFFLMEADKIEEAAGEAIYNKGSSRLRVGSIFCTVCYFVVLQGRAVDCNVIAEYHFSYFLLHLSN
jgi:hypothetical protein